jgi:hypothetical protein
MKINTLSSNLLAIAIAAAGCILPAHAQEKAGNPTRTGTVSVVLKNVHGVLNTGAPDPAHDVACRTQLSNISSKYVGLPVKTTYSINTQTGVMTAQSTFPSPNSAQPLQLTAVMHPLGLSGVYSFGGFRPPTLPNAYVLFSISTQFTNAKSTFLVINAGKNYNCVISSDSNIFSSAESVRLKDADYTK